MPQYVYYQSVFKNFTKFSLLFPHFQLLVQVSLSLFPVVVWLHSCLLVGLSTVDRMSHMYGTVIRVPSAVPVDNWSCDYRIR